MYESRADLLLFERMCVSDFAVMLHLDSRVILTKARTENILTLCMFTMHDNYTGYARYNFVPGLLFVPCGLFLHRFDISISLNDEISIFK